MSASLRRLLLRVALYVRTAWACIIMMVVERSESFSSDHAKVAVVVGASLARVEVVESFAGCVFKRQLLSIFYAF